MNRYVLARQADQDLEEIAEYLATQNPQASVRILDALHETFQRLGRQPFSGRSLEHFRTNLRYFPGCQPADRYVVFYYPTQRGVEIATILHSRRDWSSLFISGER